MGFRIRTWQKVLIVVIILIGLLCIRSAVMIQKQQNQDHFDKECAAQPWWPGCPERRTLDEQDRLPQDITPDDVEYK